MTAVEEPTNCQNVSTLHIALWWWVSKQWIWEDGSSICCGTFCWFSFASNIIGSSGTNSKYMYLFGSDILISLLDGQLYSIICLLPGFMKTWAFKDPACNGKINVHVWWNHYSINSFFFFFYFIRLYNLYFIIYCLDFLDWVTDENFILCTSKYVKCVFCFHSHILQNRMENSLHFLLIGYFIDIIFHIFIVTTKW